MEQLEGKADRRTITKFNITSMNDLSYFNVHNRFKLNGFHLDREDLCRVAYSFIKEGDDFEKPVGIFILDWFDNNDYIDMHTSGSTGTPKNIRVKKQAMVNSAIATGNFFGIEAGDKALHCLPVKYVSGKMMLVRGFILGLDMDLVAPASQPLKNNTTIYAFSAMVPLQAQQSLAKLASIKKLIIGGAKINATLEIALAALPTECYETYGMTETVSHIAARKVGEKVFTVFPEVSVNIDDRNCLVINAHLIADFPIITNDLVDLISDTEFVWKGRIDNIVNSGGIKLIPEQIEEKLAKRIDQRFFITGIADENLGHKLLLVIEGNPYTLPEDLFDTLDKYEIPKEIKFVKCFVQTGSGKIIRSESLSE